MNTGGFDAKIARLSLYPYTIGLAASTIFERSAEPVTFSRCVGAMLTPGVSPNVTAKLPCRSPPISRPPLRTNFVQMIEARPAEARTHIVGLVDLPRFGVSGVFFHGSGLPYIGMPWTIACGFRARPGAKMITSYFARRSSFAARPAC